MGVLLRLLRSAPNIFILYLVIYCMVSVPNFAEPVNRFDRIDERVEKTIERFRVEIKEGGEFLKKSRAVLVFPRV